MTIVHEGAANLSGHFIILPAPAPVPTWLWPGWRRHRPWPLLRVTWQRDVTPTPWRRPPAGVIADGWPDLSGRAVTRSAPVHHVIRIWHRAAGRPASRFIGVPASYKGKVGNSESRSQIIRTTGPRLAYRLEVCMSHGMPRQIFLFMGKYRLPCSSDFSRSHRTA